MLRQSRMLFHFLSRIVYSTVAGHECYSSLDGFSSYNQIRMHPNDQEKTTFVTEWGVFVAVVMMFGLKTAPTTFQRIITEIFDDYILTFLQIFLDHFAMYGKQLEHLTRLRLCLARCRQARLSLNPTKCVMNTGYPKARTLGPVTHLVAPYLLGHLDYVIIVHVIIKRCMHTTL